MMPDLSLQNFLSWAAQVSVIALAGAVLPAIFRIHHPRSHLAWCHALLLACIVLPLIQPWLHPVISGPTASRSELADTANVTDGTPSGQAPIPWSRIVAWILLAGIVARLSWFLGGLRQIRRYRNAATPLRYLPEPVRWARKLTNRDAFFYISAGDIGPEAGLPVMEGKSLLFKYLGGVDAYPICLGTKKSEEIENAVRWLQPSFGGVNLEDISQPKCFDILDAPGTKNRVFLKKMSVSAAIERADDGGTRLFAKPARFFRLPVLSDTSPSRVPPAERISARRDVRHFLRKFAVS